MGKTEESWNQASMGGLLIVLLMLGSSLNGCGRAQEGVKGTLKSAEDYIAALPAPLTVFGLARTAMHPRLSPDGKKVCYWDVSEKGFKGEYLSDYALYIANADGSGRLNLAEPLVVSSHCLEKNQQCRPAWSPAGDAIAFSWRSFPESGANIVLASLGGKRVKKIFGEEEGRCLELSNVSWSPDGRHIAFLARWGRDASEASEDGRADPAALHVLHADGTERFKRDFAVRAFPYHENSDTMMSVDWSRDGKNIVAVTCNGIYLCSAEEGDLTRIYDPEADGENPSSYLYSHGVVQWSPEGRKLAFHGVAKLHLFDFETRELKSTKISERVDGVAWFDATDHLLVMTHFENPSVKDIPGTIKNIGEGPRRYRHQPVIVDTKTGNVTELSGLAVDDYEPSMLKANYPRVCTAFSMWSR